MDLKTTRQNIYLSTTIKAKYWGYFVGPYGYLLKGELNSILASTLWKKGKGRKYVFLIFVVRNAILTGYSLYSAQFLAVSRAERLVPS